MDSAKKVLVCSLVLLAASVAAKRADAPVLMRARMPQAIAAASAAPPVKAVSQSPMSAAELPPFSRRNPVTEAVEKTKDSIVCIKVPRPGGGPDMISSGVIVSEDGLVVCARHAVGGHETVRVFLRDGTEHVGRRLARQDDVDLDALQLKGVFKAVRVGRGDDLMVGETVIAIGHPLGYSNTVSTGIISALGRDITLPTQVTLRDMIQTTAPINPGSSGGALLNINGELIGINVALREGANGIAFATHAGTMTQFLASKSLLSSGGILTSGAAR